MLRETTNVNIRPERVTDYAEIGALHAYAFGNRAGEALIVTLLRARRTFDPALSLVAEIHGRIVGHVLFTPYSMRLLDQRVPTVNLAPIAVDPAYQGQGIGSKLLTEGHHIAADKGYKISILLGHPTYYPRFGYRTQAFGAAQMRVSSAALEEDLLQVRSPNNEDGPLLANLWNHEEGRVDMALEPGQDLLDWISPHPAVQASVYMRNNEMVGYTRIHTDEPTRPRIFLAYDVKAARAMVVTMASTLQASASGTEYVLPLHPFSSSAKAFGRASANSYPFPAGMACELGTGPLDDYFARIQGGQRPAGRPIWPVAFDLS